MTTPFILQDRGLRAFLGDPSVKTKFLARVEAHRAADEIVQGVYTEKYGRGKLRGCAVGCTIHSGDHAAYETELGIPRWIARLEDRLFEMMPIENAVQWPGKFLEAIPVGADLNGVYPKFIDWMLTNPEFGVMRFMKDEQLRTHTQAIVDHYRAGTMTREIGRALADKIWARRSRATFWEEYYRRCDERDRLRRRAVELRAKAEKLKQVGDPAAAEAAAAAAAEAAAAEAAAAAAEAAEAAAAAAAAAFWSAEYRKVKGGAILRQSEKLLELLREAPVAVAA